MLGAFEELHGDRVGLVVGFAGVAQEPANSRRYGDVRKWVIAILLVDAASLPRSQSAKSDSS